MAAGDCESSSAKQQRLKTCLKIRVLCQVVLFQGPCLLVLLAPSSHLTGAQGIIYLREPIIFLPRTHINILRMRTTKWARDHVGASYCYLASGGDYEEIIWFSS